MELRTLHIDDDPKILENISEILNGEIINGNELIIIPQNFEEGLQSLKEEDYDLLILDLFKGPEKEGGDAKGEEILKYIQSTSFIPVIFFTALPKHVEHLSSEIIRIASKGDGIDNLKSQIANLIQTGFINIKRKVYEFTKQNLREYFWDFVNQKQKLIEAFKKDHVSIGYLLMRRLANQLSKEKIKSILEDPQISDEKAHPMEFYVYPPLKGEYEAGEILEREGRIFSILTPSCDFVKRSDGKRKVENTFLVEGTPVEKMEEYSKYKSNNDKYKESLIKLIENRKTDRYFFLPQTPFIDNYVFDFQKKVIVSYEELSSFNRIAKLDDPFAQAMLASFIRYYNRVGTPDIDSGFIISKLK